MRLPVQPPVKPMLARSAPVLPAEGGVLYEPKWDGFRCIVFRDGDEVELGSRNEKPLTRYFPDVVEAVKAELPPRCVVDGEIVIAGPDGLDFDALQLRIHPAASRVKMLAAQSPASFVAFDLLALDDTDYRGRTLAQRRARLVEALGGVRPPIHLTPATEDRSVALDWFARFEGAGLDGVVAKSLSLEYRSDKRVMTKVKHERTADCVVAGYRWHKSGSIVGSLLLGLYDDAGVLHHLGVTASFTMARRAELVAELAPYRVAEDQESAYGFDGRGPGGPNRWNAGAERSFVPLRPELVCEVAYDHLQGDRFRHATTFRRWRPDKAPADCTYAQLETSAPEELSAVFGAGSGRQTAPPGGRFGPKFGVEGVEGVIDAWVAAWNEGDGGRRAALLERAAAEECVYVGPTGSVQGREAIDAAIEEAREYMPGAVVVRTGAAYQEQGEWHFGWQVRTSGGDAVLGGVDSIAVNEAGLLTGVVVLAST